MQDKTQMTKLVTHNGSFHADDVFATATLATMFEARGEAFEVIRTRDEEVIKTGDYVFDVGGVYDKEDNKFDHHQMGGAGERSNGIPYASFGLVWEKFGVEICGSKKMADFIDDKLVAPVDAGDNGVELCDIKGDTFPYFIQSALSSFVRTWKEDPDKEDEYFLQAVKVAKEILQREIIWAKDTIEAESLVLEDYESAKDKRVILLRNDYPAKHVLSDFTEPLFVIYQKSRDKMWAVKAIRSSPKTFKNRMDFPREWGGLRDKELQKVSGVPDAVFCHRGLFLAIAKSQEGALKLAELALLTAKA